MRNDQKLGLLRVEETQCRVSPLTDPAVQISRSGFFRRASPRPPRSV